MTDTIEQALESVEETIVTDAKEVKVWWQGTTIGQAVDADAKAAIAELETIGEAQAKQVGLTIGTAALAGLATGGAAGAFAAGVAAAPAAFAAAEKTVSTATINTLVSTVVNQLSATPVATSASAPAA